MQSLCRMGMRSARRAVAVQGMRVSREGVMGSMKPVQTRWNFGGPGAEAEQKEIMDEMRNDIKAMKVCLFMKGEPEAPRCGFSGKVVDLMAQYAVPYTSYNVLAHPAVREGIKEISGWPTIPQLFVDGEFVGGCDLMIEMHESGDLADLFKNAGIRYRDPKTGIVAGPVQGSEDEK
eukprot:TRINITY_DN6712_c0_g1_i1.p1 TRINITY_DN6712_c0_g1~~TRINITY_DN6712_c0_g1_i1.p1  ORF type:complete len:176 (+),score=42.03 TRINITY_DN6712_c0_g1_i1:50-577(+)